VSPGMHELLKMLWDEWQDLDRRLSDCTPRIEAVMAQDEVC